MRGILFKAKRLDDGEWVEGYYVFFKDTILKDILHVIFWGNHFQEWHEIDPETLCQYTGLTDSNGVKVFDGDILKFTDNFNDYEWIGRMEFGNPNAGYTWGWQLVHLSGEEPNIDTLCWFDMEKSGAYSEIIGNIHDEEE